MKVVLVLVGVGTLLLAACGETRPVNGVPVPPATTVVATPTSTEQAVDPIAEVTPTKDAETVAQAWIRSTMYRKDLARAWDLTAPDWQSKHPRPRWIAGEVPVVPMPKDWRLDSFEIVKAFRPERTPEDLVIRYALIGQRTTDKASFRWEWFITLVERDGAWRVKFFTPQALPTLGFAPA